MIRVEHTPPKPSGRWTILYWIASIVILILSLATAGFAAWAHWIPEPLPQALAALESSVDVTVEQNEWIVFTPAAQSSAPSIANGTLEHQSNSGLIFYPGGRVDARAYAPAAHAIAQEGVLVVVVPMPLNLAFFAPGSARAVIQAFPHIDAWYVGGHSLGGAMAADFVYHNAECCAGLVLWAAYPAENRDLSEYANLRVLSVYGTLDGLATPEKVLNARPILPPATRFVPVAGGNHAQFGWYGPQAGDNPATIERLEQERRVVEITRDFLLSLE